VRGTSTRDALDGAITAITAAGCETPRLDAELLLADALGVSRERLVVDGDLVVEGPAVRVFQNAIRRRAVGREPVAYILGRRGFRGLELAVDPRALIPRPETELLVEVGLGLPREAHVLDVGTGSGAVALACANGERLGLAVSWLCADLLAGVPDEFDAILCNPPYVAESERSSLAPEILRHEPHEALFAGEDGLAVIGELLSQLAGRSRVAFVALETGAGQARPVAGLTRAAGFQAVRTERDLAGIERVVVGERR
jgi:release factor glutamine methyltransferase